MNCRPQGTLGARYGCRRPVALQGKQPVDATSRPDVEAQTPDSLGANAVVRLHTGTFTQLIKRGL